MRTACIKWDYECVGSVSRSFTSQLQDFVYRTFVTNCNQNGQILISLSNLQQQEVKIAPKRPRSHLVNDTLGTDIVHVLSNQSITHLNLLLCPLCTCCKYFLKVYELMELLYARLFDLSDITMLIHRMK